MSGDDFIFGIYVDNILLSGKNKERMKEVKSILSKMFDVKDLGAKLFFRSKSGAKPQGWHYLDRSTHIHRICIKEV